MVETTDPVTGTEYATAEFEALRDMLDSEGIEWHDNSDSMFHRTQGEPKGRRFSAIFGSGLVTVSKKKNPQSFQYFRNCIISDLERAGSKTLFAP